MYDAAAEEALSTGRPEGRGHDIPLCAPERRCDPAQLPHQSAGNPTVRDSTAAYVVKQSGTFHYMHRGFVPSQMLREKASANAHCGDRFDSHGGKRLPGPF
jgi:hypothetical protein